MTGNEADSRFAAYADALRREVCRNCLDGAGDGSCGLRGRTCPLDAQLPAVLAAIQGIRSDNLDDYTKAVQQDVCSACPSRSGDGSCVLRERADCALVAYLPLVVDALEDEDAH